MTWFSTYRVFVVKPGLSTRQSIPQRWSLDEKMKLRVDEACDEMFRETSLLLADELNSSDQLLINFPTHTRNLLANKLVSLDIVCS